MRKERRERTLITIFVVLGAAMLNLSSASAQTPASRFATLSGQRIHYVSYGEGKEALVFVHGGVGNLNNWKLQTPAFMGKKRLILLDLPGHGQSDKPKIIYSMDLFAQAIDAVLRDAGVNKAVLVGISMGTPVIRQFYRRYPEKTEALVFVDGPLRPLAPTQEIGEEFIAPFRKPDYIEAARRFNAGLMTGKIPAEMREQILDSWARTPQHVIVSVLEQVILPKTDPAIWIVDPIKVPALGVYTKNDYVPADNEQYLRRLAADAEYHAWSDVGHGIPMEMPREFNNTLQAFLVRIGFLDEKRPAQKEIPTKYFEAFIGEWEAPPEVKEKRPELKGKIQKTFAWGSHKRPVRILEGCAYNQTTNCMLEGFSFWNPVTGKVEYHAYNNQADLLYKGEYTLLEKDKLQLAAEVHYPNDHDFAKRGHPVISFRITYSLRDQDTLDINIAYYNKKDNRWDPWGGDDSKGNYLAIRSFLTLDANPLENLENLQRITRRVKQGLSLSLSPATPGQEAPQPARFAATHIAGSVYLLRPENQPLHDNVVVSVGEDGMLLVDTAYPETEPELRRVLGALRAAPVKFIINTHYHHAGANAAFGREATIIAHRNARERMKRETKMYGVIKIGPWAEHALPQITFDDNLRLHFNGEEIRLQHFPNVHTDGDAIVIFTRSNVVATGDFFVPLLGVCDAPNGCDWRRYVAGVQRLLEVIPKDAKLAPGHGSPSSYADLKDFAGMLSEVTGFVQMQIQAGKKLEEIKSQGLPARWRSWSERGVSADFFLTNAYEGLTTSATQTDK